MKRLILFFALLFASLFIVDRLLALVLDQVYVEMRTGQTGGRINYYTGLPQPPELLIMGNSRALHQVIPDSFHVSAFNLSHAGMRIAFQTGLLSVLASENRVPATILLHIEPFEFTGEQSSSDIQNLKYYYGKNALVTRYFDELPGYERLKFAFELYRYNGRLLTLLKNYFQSRLHPYSGNGYEPVTPTGRDSLNTIYSLNKAQTVEYAFNYAQLPVLEQFIEICRRNTTRLICFTSPVFRGGIRHRNASRILDSLFAAKNIPYINYTQQPIDLLDEHPTLWKDAYHLNHLGAQLQSGLLTRAVEDILAENR